LFKHSADRIPVLCILALSALDFTVYALVDSLWLLLGYFLLMILPKAHICAWNHHHQHTPTFRHALPNRILEFFYALHTGVTTNLWLLHHVYGHHLNFLDQSKDESRWARADGSKMGELEYTLEVAATAYWRGYRVGKNYPDARRAFVAYSLLTFAALLTLVAIDPLAGVLVFGLPMVVGLTVTAWATYEHHSGLNVENEFEASFNNLNRWYNLFTGNLGYHTAHHHRGGLHWSKLPKLHAQIADKIPEELIRHSWTKLGGVR
jgi:fatty acid desaturase